VEVRDYWRVVWRRRYAIVPLVAVTFVASLLFNLVLPPVYKSETTVHVAAVLPARAPGTPAYYSEEYYRTIHSEYIADDLGVIVKSQDFAAKIAERVKARYGQSLEVKDVVDSIAATKKVHRTLKITVATGNEALTRAIGEAADDVLRSEAAAYFSRGDTQTVQINVIDPPQNPTAPGPIRRLLDVLLHTAVAGVFGIGLAFLLHYTDDRVHDVGDVTRTLSWPVLATIPRDDARHATQTSTAALAWNDLVPRRWRKTPAA
jgi:capsular polysaccharide biosynthesis protein